MLKAGNLARREDHRVRGSKAGEPDEIGGYHMYADIQCQPNLALISNDQKRTKMHLNEVRLTSTEFEKFKFNKGSLQSLEKSAVFQLFVTREL